MNTSQKANPADKYQRYFVPAMFERWAVVLMDSAQPRPGTRALDIACGTGVVARHLAPRLGEHGAIVALDMNPAMLAVARSLPAPSGAPIDWRLASAAPLPFDAETFDTIVCQHGLQFFPDRAAAVSEMRRTMKPQGRTAAMVLQSLALHPVFERLMTAVAGQLKLPLSAVAKPFGMSNAAQLRDLFTNAGFSRVDVNTASIQARFGDPHEFVGLAIESSAAAIPAFAQMDDDARANLVAAVRDEAGPLIGEHVVDGAVSFPMFANVVVASA